MGVAKVTILEDRIIKEYPEHEVSKLNAELYAYQNIGFATPKLIDVS